MVYKRNWGSVSGHKVLFTVTHQERVKRERKTKKQELLKAKELLQIAKANILGVVYNGTKKESDLTYYYQSFE